MLEEHLLEEHRRCRTMFPAGTSTGDQSSAPVVACSSTQEATRQRGIDGE